MKPKILLIASHIHIAEPFRAALEKSGFAVTVADSSPSPSRAPHTERFALVVNLQQNGRHEIGDAAISSHPIDAAFLSPNRAFPGSIQLFRNGVYRLGADGADLDKFVNTVKELFGEHHASCQRDESQHGGDPDKVGQLALTGQSPQIKEVLRLTKHLCQFPGVTVLITGESGAGKEVVANLLHYSSPRAGKPFIPVNCGAIPDALFESEFFGHCKGAFTGAHTAKKGLVEEAQDGTLFLDEVSTMTLSQQIKVLRLLENHTYRRVGETLEHLSNAWIIAATNEELEALVAEGRFREDLYARLNGLEIKLPSLRERQEDILPLAQTFLAKYAAVHNVSVKILSKPVIDILQHYHWPRNVRELEHLMRTLTVTVDDDTILPLHLPAEFGKMKSAPTSGYENVTALEDFEKAYIVNMLQKTGGNLSEAARLLGIDRHTLARRIRKHHIRIGAFRTN